MSCKYYSVLSLLTLIVTILTLSSCKDTQEGPSKDIVFPDSNVSFSQHVGPLFQQKCATALCHGSTNPASGLNLEYPSYQALLNRPGLVVQHDGSHSTLIQYLNGTFEPRMPPANFPQLNQNQISGVKKWIDEGAMNN